MFGCKVQSDKASAIDNGQAVTFLLRLVLLYQYILIHLLYRITILKGPQLLVLFKITLRLHKTRNLPQTIPHQTN